MYMRTQEIKSLTSVQTKIEPECKISKRNAARVRADQDEARNKREWRFARTISSRGKVLLYDFQNGDGGDSPPSPPSEESYRLAKLIADEARGTRNRSR